MCIDTHECAKDCENTQEMKYSNGKIYKIVLKDSAEDAPCYIGSTCVKYLSTRLRGHKAQFRMCQSGKKHYVSSFQLLKQGECNIFLIENFPCHSIDELRSRERFYIERLLCVNKHIPSRTGAEWRESHKGVKKEYDHQYYIDHQDTRSESSKRYYRENSEEVNRKKREKVECDQCGVSICRGWRPHHSRNHDKRGETGGSDLCT